MANKKIAAKKKTGTQHEKGSRPKRIAPVKPSTYKLERGVTKPPVTSSGAALTPERVALDALGIDHSFLITDKSLIKRTRDIITRMQRAGKKRFTLRRMSDGWRAWRIA